MLNNSNELIVQLTQDTEGARRLDASKKLLLERRPSLASYHDIGDLAIKAEDGDSNARACEYHLTQVRNALLHVLYGHEFFVGVSLIEDLVFEAFKNPSNIDPIIFVAQTLLNIHDLGNGIAVFPLHSVRFPVTLFAESAEVMSLNLDSQGIRVFPQARSYEKMEQNIQEALIAFGITNPVPNDLLAHWYRSRSLEWLINNPLLVVRIHNIPGNYYENQNAMMNTMHFSTSLIYGLAALSPPNGDEEVFNTRIVNNRETLDYKHYLTLYPTDKTDPLESDCVPLHRSIAGLVELSDLDVFLSSESALKASPGHFNYFCDGISENRKYLFSHILGGTKATRSTAHARLARKMTSSLRSFRRSHYSTIYADERSMNLATAFEVLLTDNYSRGVGGTLRRHTEEALKIANVNDAAARGEEIGELYNVRCEITHAGAAPGDKKLNLDRLRETYVIVYGQIAAGLKHLSPNAENPVSEILKITKRALPCHLRIASFAKGMLRHIQL